MDDKMTLKHICDTLTMLKKKIEQSVLDVKTPYFFIYDFLFQKAINFFPEKNIFLTKQPHNGKRTSNENLSEIDIRM